MKKIFLSLLTIGILAVPIAGIAVTSQELPERTAEQTLGVIDYVLNLIFGIFLVIASICLIIGGFHFIMSGGDPEKVGTGRNFVLYGIIGVIIAVLARGIIALARYIAGGGTAI